MGVDVERLSVQTLRTAQAARSRSLFDRLFFQPGHLSVDDAGGFSTPMMNSAAGRLTAVNLCVLGTGLSLHRNSITLGASSRPKDVLGPSS